MTSFKVRGHPMEPHVRVLLENHPVVEAFHRRFGGDIEQTRRVVTESALDAMDLLGDRYVGKMSHVVGQLTQLRDAIHLVYEKVLSGSGEPIDRAALQRAFEELHARSRELADPKAWAETEGQHVEPLPVTAGYPGERTGLEHKPTTAPREGDPVRAGRAGRAGRTGSPAGKWTVKTKRRGDITLELDAEGLYWKFPPLEDGVVLHFPEYGYRVWKEPGTGAIVEELLVGPSVSGNRALTRGEDVIFSAAEMGEAYRNAGTQRAHGAGAPGLGFDAGYGIAHAIQRINGWIEGNGLEAWVRKLRDNAEPGVDYVWTTTTYKRGQMLAERRYTISAIADGRLHELYAFELTVPEGPPSVDAPVEFAIVGVTPEAETYGAPYTRKSLAAHEAAPASTRPPLERLEPPDVVSRALGRTQRAERVPGHPATARTAERIQSLTRILETTILRRIAGLEKVGEGRQARLRHPEEAAWSGALDELTNVVGVLDERVRTSPENPERLARIDATITAFNHRARSASPADLHALAAQLRTLMRGR